MNDRSYTFLFWSAISLTCHVLLIILLSKQPSEERSTLQVSIIAGTAVQAVQTIDTRAAQAVAEADIPEKSVFEPNTVGSIESKPTPTVRDRRIPAPLKPPPGRDDSKAHAADDSQPELPADNKTDADSVSLKAESEEDNQAQQDEQAVARSLAMMPTTNSSYWRYLMQRLADPRWHHRQYDLRTLRRPRTLAMDLEFTSMGVLRASRIALGSGIEQLDAAAIRASYAAAPYQAPPPEDRDNGFVYRIRIGYQPAAN